MCIIGLKSIKIALALFYLKKYRHCDIILYMMNTEKFRNDILEKLKGGMSQGQLVKLSGVPQSTLSSFLTSKGRGITLELASKLWPFVYGEPFPGGKK